MYYTKSHSHTHTHTHTPTHSHTHTLTGQPGWGIAFFINGTIIPELVVERGRTYTFLVYGGEDPADNSNYHPFYITDSINGGRLLNTQQERAVSTRITLFHLSKRIDFMLNPLRCITYTCTYFYSSG
jgi:hypothetical protein